MLTRGTFGLIAIHVSSIIEIAIKINRRIVGVAEKNR